MATATIAERPSIDLPNREDAVPNREDAVEALERILSSSDFLASDRNRRFLTYIVEETLAGRAGRLKGYNIALEVFGRDTCFDSQTNPLVRIEAGRLRRSLEHYYLTAGCTDPFRISIPKGGYAPLFEHLAREQSPIEAQPPLQSAASIQRYENSSSRRRARIFTAGLGLLVVIGAAVLSVSLIRQPANVLPSPATRPVKDGPSLLVQRFANLSGDPAEDYFAFGLTEELVAAVTRFKSIKVFAGMGDESGSPSDAVPPGAHIGYILKGSVRKLGDWFRVTVRLVDGGTGQQLWTETYDRGPASGQSINIQSDVASNIAEAVGHPYNVLFTHEAKRLSAGSKGFETYNCVLKIYAYWEQLKPAQHRELRDCHELAVTTSPTYTDAWVNLAWLYIDEHRFDYNRSPSARPPLDRAADAARNALALEPDNARAHLVMAIVYWFGHDLRAFDQEAELALSLNENDTSVAAELGLRFALRGNWERAQPLLDRAVARAPFKPHLYRVAYALHAYESGDYDLALKEAERTRLRDNPVAQVLEAASCGQIGRTDQARKIWQAIRDKAPHIADGPRFWMFDHGFSDSYIDRLMDGLDRAGVLSGE